MNQYEIEKKLEEINKAFKTKLNNELIRSTLRKTPNKYNEYNSEIGGIKFEIKFYPSVMRVVIKEDAYRFVESRVSYFIRYIQKVATSCNRTFLQLEYTSKGNEMDKFKACLSKMGFVGDYDRDSYRNLVGFSSGDIWDDLNGEATKNISEIRRVQDALKQIKTGYDAFNFSSVEDDSLYGFQVIYKGFEGLLRVELKEKVLYLVEKTLEVEKEITADLNLTEYITYVLELGSKQFRLKNMLSPVRHNFDRKMKDLFQISVTLSKEIFDHLMDDHDPVEIEENILKEEIVSINGGGNYPVRVLSIFNMIFVVSSHYKYSGVFRFGSNELHKAYSCFEENLLSIIRFEKDWEFNNFKKRHEEKMTI